MTFPQHPSTPDPGLGAIPDESVRPVSAFGTDNSISTFSTNRRRFLSWGGLAAGAVMVGGVASACGTAQTGRSSGGGGGSKKSGGQSGRTGATADTVFIAGLQWDPPKSFNPLAASTTWPAGQNQQQLIFETLLRFNLVSGELEPGLGKDPKDVDKRTYQVTLQDGTKWQDGQDLTTDDVIFTFELAKKAAVSYSNVWDYLQEIKAVDDRTLQFIAKSKPLNMITIKNTIAGTYILPKHIYEPWVNNKTVTSQANLKNPVGSGPFQVQLADQTQVVLKRYDDYWGNSVFGKPAMTNITHPIFKSNSDGDLKLQSGDIDVSQQFTAQIWKMWEDKGASVGTYLKDKPYYIPGNIPLLQINVTKKGLDNPKVRLAMAYAIDYATIVATAMSSYSDVPQASLILPTGFEKTYFDQAAVESQGWKYDQAKAKSILEDELGAKKGSDGVYKLKDGTRLGPWKLITPTGWTDWNSACEIAAKSLKAVGFDVSTQFPEAGNVTTDVQNGNFDLVCWSASGVSPASPWSRFHDILDDRLGAPIGKTAFANYTRFKDSRIPALLDAASEATTDDERKTAYGKVDAIYRETVPVIPLMYRPLEFFEFNTATWTNWPTESNPYGPPGFGGAGIDWVFKVKKAGS
ncbi:peptide ABC transporter substrate-binding protein [Microlunatus endophyticus]|uniref:Peptide ABC transporter substrate-binding protein n=1 Tax=Microlunatus endophyticus TaxID=1716077 RepID=A0A917SGM4_9ACTN|nr:ABC transporter substrate-binding protein [Microlunatus endophyticus]GGL77835.1 peptide ABC transporter substrate-binding protein [Microlunatus endophyticus]